MLKTTKDVIRALGEERMRVGLGLKNGSAIRVRVGEGTFPADWLDVLEKMCAEKGLNCPRELFNMRPRRAVSASAEGSDLSASCGQVGAINQTDQPGSASNENSERENVVRGQG